MEKKFHFIYKITNLINNRYYYGMHSTNNLDDGYFGSGKLIRLSVKKYGQINHKFEILEFLPNRELLKNREKEIITMNEISKKDCLNLVEGGHGGGKIWSEEHMKKFSKSGNKSFLEKMSNPYYRERFSNKMSEINKESYHKFSKGEKFVCNWEGRKHSEETKKKMSEDRKNKYGLGESNSNYGSKWMTKNGISKLISKNDIQTFVNDGWSFGRIVNKKTPYLRGFFINLLYLKSQRFLYSQQF